MWKGKKLPFHYHPLRILLESDNSGRRTRKEAIFLRKTGFSCEKSPVLAVHAAKHDFYDRIILLRMKGTLPWRM